MEFVPLLVLAALVKKTIDWLRVLIPDNIEAKILIPVSMLVGVAFAFLFSLSPELAGKIEIWSEQNLANASVALVAVYGLALGSIGGVLHDFVKPSTPPHDSEERQPEPKPVPYSVSHNTTGNTGTPAEYVTFTAEHVPNPEPKPGEEVAAPPVKKAAAKKAAAKPRKAAAKKA